MKENTHNLPIDPLPGELYQAPEGVSLGESTVIDILNPTGDVIGTTTGTGKVENVSRKWVIERTVTSIDLVPDLRIRIRATQFNITALVFYEYFGWAPYTYEIKEVLTNTSFFVSHCVLISRSANQRIYEKVFLSATEEPYEKKP